MTITVNPTVEPRPMNERAAFSTSLGWQVWVAYLLMSMVGGAWSMARYQGFNAAWPWDLAHINQSFWDITHGVPVLTVRPANHYAAEGPEPWRSVHVAVTRALLLLPAYALLPRPETLLLGHAFVHGLTAVALASLAGGGRAGRRAVLLWLVTPAAWAFLLNDCRPLQIGLPFFLWGVKGFVERRPILFWCAALAAIASRQEYALTVGLLPLLRPLISESRGNRFKWTLFAGSLALLGAAGYVGYLRLLFGTVAAHRYLFAEGYMERTPAELLAAIVQTPMTLLLLAGPWAILSWRRPAPLAASLPFIAMMGRVYGPDFLPGDEGWHHVRYAALPLAFWLAGGALSLRSCVAVESKGSRQMPTCSLILTGVSLVLTIGIMVRLHRQAASFTADEVAAIHQTIRQVDQRAFVWSDYAFSAALSSRPFLFSTREVKSLALVEKTADVEGWAFLEGTSVSPLAANTTRFFDRHGFQVVYRTPRVEIRRRPVP